MKTKAFVAWLDDVQLLTYVGQYFVLMNFVFARYFGFDFYYGFDYYCSHPAACAAVGLDRARAVVCHDFVSSVALQVQAYQMA